MKTYDKQIKDAARYYHIKTKKKEIECTTQAKHSKEKNEMSEIAA